MSSMNDEKKEAIRLLKTSRGQIDGIIKMIEEDRYCIDITTQIMSTLAILKKSNMKILEQHMKHCVKEAINQEDVDIKIKEMLDVLKRMNK